MNDPVKLASESDRYRAMANSVRWSAICAILLWIGVGGLSWGQGTHFPSEELNFGVTWWAVGALSLAGFVGSLYPLLNGVMRLYASPDPSATPVSQDEYSRYLILVGTMLVVLSLAIAIVLSSPAYLKSPSGVEGIAAPQPKYGTLALSIAMAILGSLFFIANSLVLKRRSGDEPFNDMAFWSGLWFRIGEALLFVLVLFLIISGSTGHVALGGVGFEQLPAAALLVGMFVKSGERVIFGLAERMFGMISGLLPAAEGGAQALPGRPRNAKVTPLSGSQTEGVLTWDEPLNGGNIESYQVVRQQGAAKPEALGETHSSIRELKITRGAGAITVRAGNRAAGLGEPSQGIEFA